MSKCFYLNNLLSFQLYHSDQKALGICVDVALQTQLYLALQIKASFLYEFTL